MKKIQFKIGKAINVIGVSLITGLMCFSCAKDNIPEDENGKGSSSDGEEGLISLSLKIDATTKADEEPGTDGENNIKNIRVILYALDGIVDKAAYIFDYNLPDGAPDGLINYGDPTYQTKAQRVKIQDYRLVVLVNYFNPTIQATKNILADATAIPGHPISTVINPIDYYVPSQGMWKGTAFNFLTGYDDSTPVTDGTDPASGLFFMSNANGVTEIKESMIRGSEMLAETYPVTISVERGVAKVSVSEGVQLRSNLNAAGATISFDDFSWRVDIMNMQMYPLRRPTYTAPYGPGKGAMENSGTSRYNRYAQDPNFDNVSRDRNPSAGGSAVNVNFERITDGLDPRTGKPYFGQLFMARTGADLVANNVEYVLENTMDAAEQYEDVTTRILFRGNYVPPCITLPAYNPPQMVSSAGNARVTAGSVQTRGTVSNPDGSVTACFAPGESYFSYNGVAFSVEQMRLMYENPEGRIPNEIRLRGLYEFFTNYQVPNPDFGNTAKGFDIRFSPYNPYFNENDPLGEVNNPYGIPNWPWNKLFFDEFSYPNGYYTKYVSGSDLYAVDGAPVSSIPVFYSDEYTTDRYYCYSWGTYDPDAPDFINAFSPVIPNPLLEQFAEEFPWILDDGAPKVAKSWRGVNYHLNGISYYSTPIRHFEDVQSPLHMGYGRYGVVRNCHYKITVDNIKGPGSPVIPAPGDEDDAYKWISVSVKAMPWLMHIQYMPLQ